MTSKMINMDGSDDPFYRYTMPKLEVKVEGTTKMIKSVLVNIEDVARAINRPEDYLVTYFGQQLSANSKVDNKEKRMYISGKHEAPVLQEACFKFIRETVRCNECGNPETVPECTGKKKNMGITLHCVSCGGKTVLDPTDRFVKYMTQHPMAIDDKYKKKKSKKGASEEDVQSPDGEGVEKKKKKKKDKSGAGGDDGEEGGAVADGDKKKKKKKKEVDETDAIASSVGEMTMNDDDDDDDDWCMDTSASAVSARAESHEKAQQKVASVASPAVQESTEEEEDDDGSDVDIDGI